MSFAETSEKFLQNNETGGRVLQQNCTSVFCQRLVKKRNTEP